MVFHRWIIQDSFRQSKRVFYKPDWLSRHPDTLVLNLDTGFNCNYKANPYDGDEKESSIMFPVRFRSEGYHPKEQVLGLVLDGEAKAKVYPFIELAKKTMNLRMSLAGNQFRYVIIRYTNRRKFLM